MNIKDCKYAQEGVAAFHAGLGLSHNPYVAGHALPYENANKWLSGYTLALLRDASVVDAATAENLGEAFWSCSHAPEQASIIGRAMIALTRTHNRIT